MARPIEYLDEGLSLQLPDKPTQELIRKLWHQVPSLVSHGLLYDSLSLAESARLQEVLHPEVADGTVEPKYWEENAPYLNGILEKLALQDGTIVQEPGSGWRDTQITPFELRRMQREADLMAVLEDRAGKRKLLSQPSSPVDPKS